MMMKLMFVAMVVALKMAMVPAQSSGCSASNFERFKFAMNDFFQRLKITTDFPKDEDFQDTKITTDFPKDEDFQDLFNMYETYSAAYKWPEHSGSTDDTAKFLQGYLNEVKQKYGLNYDTSDDNLLNIYRQVAEDYSNHFNNTKEMIIPETSC
ncbi:hypothetical protein HELRODRAFT_179354 [Helobdella robusta]|uniref:Cathepsin propeptide inhibitor domain-containing protein n=1 Tax=Helobdella robusta TaxID=6412 RepID=T1FEL3_HELRO|nr:hypothetical protein HELRODRAFT_179354 [Helobdella robusta]ESN95577.1 hypothetical protein HELRODRAFT_179354 [Helobdella robusta]